MASRYLTKNGRTAKRGLFSNGVWHCDCDNRLPADKFQTKNGGKNHGRWFYTCQKPQPSRCGFFLWEDEAKVREEGAVLSNSNTEPTSPKTPKKIGVPSRQAKLGGTAQILTPSTKSKRTAKLEAISPPSASDARDEWSSDNIDDEALASALEEFETPRKAARTDINTSPSSKQRTSSTKSDASSVTLAGHEADQDDIFQTPATSKKSARFPHTSGLLSPSTTPSKRRGPATSSPSTDPGELASSALQLLRPVALPTNTEAQLVELLNTHDLRTTGIIKGRDITRLAVQAKERKITELEARIKGLEQEKETMRTVVQHLKSDIMMSPKKPRRPRDQEPREPRDREREVNRERSVV